jgi:hypothetical protein
MVNMARWCSLTSLLLAALGLPSLAHAQSPPAYDPAVTPAGWSHSGTAYAGQKAKVRSYGPQGPLAAGPGRTIYEELPDDTGWLYQDAPIDRFLKETFRHAYFRVDYLNWSLSDPGNNLIGSDTAIIGLDQIQSGLDANGNPLVNDLLNNPFAYPNGATDPFIFQPFIDPLIPFQVSNPADNNQSLISVVQPSMREVRNDSNNGIRGTFGIDIANSGSLEFSVFALQTSIAPIERSPRFQFDIYDSNGNGVFEEFFDGQTVLGEFDRDGDGITDEVVPDFQAIAIPILIDGQVPQPGLNNNNPNPDPGLDQPTSLPPITNPLSPGTELDPETANINDTRVVPGRGDNFRIVWDLGYNASLKTAVWGSETSFLFNTWDPGSNLSLRPLVGFRYFRFAENFNQSGAYSFPTTDQNGQPITAAVARQINANTVNNLYGPQIGFRAELPSRWFTIGVTPKVMLGVNDYRAQLATQNILSPTDVDQFITETSNTFGVLGDLEAYTALHLNEYVSLRVGYNLMWAGILTRPYDNIIYNARTVQTAGPNGTILNTYESDFRQDVQFSGALIQGLNVGGEIRY